MHTGVFASKTSSQLIVFVGTVGAGKTTQMRLLTSTLESVGVKARTTCVKTNHFPASLMVALFEKIFALNRTDVFPVRALIEEKAASFKRLFRLWLTLDVASTFIRSLLRVYVPLKMRRTVIVEEYFYASIADYIYSARLLGLPEKTVVPAVNFIQRIMRLYHVGYVFFLDAPNVELNERWKKRMSLTERSDYLQMQRTLLLSASLAFSSVLYIKTSGMPIKATHELILDYILGSK